MNKRKIIGIILVILGLYFLVGNSIISLIFNYATPIGFSVPISPEEYWRNWWANFGLLTIIIALIGLIMIYIGVKIFRDNKFLSGMLKEHPKEENAQTAIKSSLES